MHHDAIELQAALDRWQIATAAHFAGQITTCSQIAHELTNQAEQRGWPCGHEQLLDDALVLEGWLFDERHRDDPSAAPVPVDRPGLTVSLGVRREYRAHPDYRYFFDGQEYAPADAERLASGRKSVAGWTWQRRW